MIYTRTVEGFILFDEAFIVFPATSLDVASGFVPSQASTNP